jgi:hypothetical protein
MHYAEIKKNLNEAGRLVDAGNISAADRKIRAMLGKGMSMADIAANLTSKQIAALRAHGKKKKDAHEKKVKATKKKATKKKATKKKATKKKATKKRASSAKKKTQPWTSLNAKDHLIGAYTVGTSAQDETRDMSYNEIVKLLGEPHLYRDGEKVAYEWVLVFDDGSIGVLHDWKENPEYEPESFGLDPDIVDEEGAPEKAWKAYERQRQRWTIGAQTKREARLVREALGNDPRDELDKVEQHASTYGKAPIEKGVPAAYYTWVWGKSQRDRDRAQKYREKLRNELRDHRDKGKPGSKRNGNGKPKKKSTGSSLRAYMREKFGV